MENALVTYLAGRSLLSESLRQELVNLSKAESYKPHQVIQPPGYVENRIFFIESGLIRSYYHDEAGSEHTLDFYLPGELYFSYEGYWQEPSENYLEAMQNTRLISLSYRQLLRLVPHYPELTGLIDQQVKLDRQREQFKRKLLNLSAGQRYLIYRKARPTLFREVSVRYIASYLNMTRENLSRLMNRHG